MINRIQIDEIVGAKCFGGFRPTWVCLLDFFCSGIQFYLLLSLGNDALISKGSFMQTKYLCVLILIWTKGEVGALWKRFKPSSIIVLLTFPRWCFFCGSFMLFLSYFCKAFLRVCLSMPCDHLLGKAWPHGFYLWSLIVKLPLSYWYPGSGRVLDCINSWSLPFFLLCHRMRSKGRQCDKSTRKCWKGSKLEPIIYGLRTVPVQLNTIDIY